MSYLFSDQHLRKNTYQQLPQLSTPTLSHFRVPLLKFVHKVPSFVIKGQLSGSKPLEENAQLINFESWKYNKRHGTKISKKKMFLSSNSKLRFKTLQYTDQIKVQKKILDNVLLVNPLSKTTYRKPKQNKNQSIARLLKQYKQFLVNQQQQIRLPCRKNQVDYRAYSPVYESQMRQRARDSNQKFYGMVKKGKVRNPVHKAQILQNMSNAILGLYERISLQEGELLIADQSGQTFRFLNVQFTSQGKFKLKVDFEEISLIQLLEYTKSNTSSNITVAQFLYKIGGNFSAELFSAKSPNQQPSVINSLTQILIRAILIKDSSNQLGNILTNAKYLSQNLTKLPVFFFEWFEGFVWIVQSKRNNFQVRVEQIMEFVRELQQKQQYKAMERSQTFKF